MTKYFLLCFLYGVTQASQDTGFVDRQIQRVAQNLISESQAIQIALRTVPGKVLSAQLNKDDGRKTYRIKILSNDGRVRTVTVNAENGQVL